MLPAPSGILPDDFSTLTILIRKVRGRMPRTAGKMPAIPESWTRVLRIEARGEFFALLQ